MFCPKCGKELTDSANFCSSCGYKINSNCNYSIYERISILLDALFKKYEANWIIKKIAAISTLLSIAIRIVCNEVYTVYSLLAQDDWFVISDSGKRLIIAVNIVTILLYAGIVAYGKTKGFHTEKKSLIAAIVGIAISVLCMLFRIPAPY